MVVNNAEGVLRKLKDEERALVFYESPHRIIDMLKDLKNIFLSEEENEELQHKDNQIFAREMTKIHEEYFFGTIEEAIEHLQDKFPNKKSKVNL